MKRKAEDQLERSEEDEDNEEEAMEEASEEAPQASCGRKRKEEAYGPDFVAFITSYVHARGQIHLADAHRVRTTVEVGHRAQTW